MIDKSNIQHNIKTGSDTDVFFSRINTDNKSADFGKIKSSNGVDKFPYLSRTTGNSLKPVEEFIQSNELRKGGAESAPRPGNTSVEGSLDIELSPTTFDDNLAAAFDNEWTPWTSDNDSAINLDHQYCQDGYFLTRANSTDESVYNDDEALKPRRLLNDGAGKEDGLITVPAGCVVHELTFGKKKIEYEVMKKYGGVEDEDMYHVFGRLAIGSVDLDAQIGSIVTGSFGFMGDTSTDIMTEDEARAHFGGEDTDKFEGGWSTGNAYMDNLPELSTSTDQFTTREGDMWINGKNITFAQSMTFNVDKNMDKKYALFVKNPIAKTSQKKAITANLSTYLVPESKELYNIANKNKTFELLFAFEDSGYMNDSFKDEDKPQFIYLFQIFSAKSEDKDLSASGADDYNMSIPLRSFGERLCRVFRIALPKVRDVEFAPADTWTAPGKITVRPNVPVTSSDISTLAVTVVLKKENGQEIETKNYTSAGASVKDSGLVEITESAFSVVTDAAYREITVTLNGDEIVRSFDATEVEPPAAPTNASIIVKSKRATITWTDSVSTDLDHTIVDVQDTAGVSVVAGNVAKGVESYTATGLTTGSTYHVDLIAVDKNGNKSTKLTKTFTTSSVQLGHVTNLSATANEQTVSASWDNPSTELDGVVVELYKDGTLVESTTVLKTATQEYSKSSLEASTEYTVKVTPYKTYDDVKLLGDTESDTATTGA